MNLKELQAEFSEKMAEVPHLHVQNKDAWSDADGKPATKDGRNVFLDVEDDEVRKEVFFKGIYRAIQKASWHPEIVRSLENVKSDVRVVSDFSNGMFSDYDVYLEGDFKVSKALCEKYGREMKSLWKTDMEFFKDCVRVIIEDIDCSDYYYFIHSFNQNQFGIDWEKDVKSNEEVSSWVKDVLFDIVCRSKSKPRDDD